MKRKMKLFINAIGTLGLLLIMVTLFQGCKTSKPQLKKTTKMEKQVIETGDIYKKLVETLNAFSRGSTGVLKSDAEEFLGSIEKDYSNYALDRFTIDSLMGYLNGGAIFIDVYGGNWCSDTRQGMGGLTRVLDACKMPDTCFRYIRVSKEKKLIDIHFEGIEITRVPLVIVHNKKKEFGRILEVPEKGKWEYHLFKILNKALNN